MKRLSIQLFLLAALAANASAESAGKKILSNIEFGQRLGDRLPLKATFTDQDGRTKELGRFFSDAPVILAPVYYECPMLCTETLNGLLRALRTLRWTAGKEFHVVAFSINPAETPDLARKKRSVYLRTYNRAGSEHGWNFLVGDQRSIDKLTAAIGFQYVPDRLKGQFAHAAGILVITPDGRIARVFFGVEFSARDLRLALIEASDRKIGSPAEKLLLYCYHYDPREGRYSLAVMNAVKAGGAVTAAILASGVLLMLKKEKRYGR